MSYGYVYKTTNLVNRRIYIGRRKGDFNPNYFGSGFALSAAIKKYGRRSFTVKVVAYADSKYEVNWIEKHCIEQYRESLGRKVLYNITNGGEDGCTPEIAVRMVQTRLYRNPNSFKDATKKGLITKAKNGTLKSTPEQIRKGLETKRIRGSMHLAGFKAAQTRRERDTEIKGEKHWLYGKTLPQHVKDAISIKLTGLKQTAETIAKRVLKNKGKRRTEEQRHRQSVVATTRWKDVSKREQHSRILTDRFKDASLRQDISDRKKKPVVQQTLDEQFVAWFPSATDAANALGVDVSTICKKCRKGISFKGFLWKYENTNLPIPS